MHRNNPNKRRLIVFTFTLFAFFILSVSVVTLAKSLLAKSRSDTRRKVIMM